MVKPPEITAGRLKNNPRLIWNTFIKFISNAETTEMNDIQMAAQLPFWYDSDIQKGGHLRYFKNKGELLGDKLNVLIMATMDALKIIGAEKQLEILAKAADVYFSKPIQNPIDPNEVNQTVLAGEFDKFDDDFYASFPDITELLEKYVMAHLDNFVKVV
jgi:hypothetical protein